MKALISILIILGAIYGLKSLFSYYKKVNKEDTVVQAPASPTTVKGEDLPGLPSTFEASLHVSELLGNVVRCDV